MNFFIEDLSSPCVLTGDEAYHCIKVLRCKAGDTLNLLNGNGESAMGRVLTVGKDHVNIEIEKRTTLKENPSKLSVAVSIPKNPARLEWFLEKATEIGIDHIFPVITQRTEKATIKMERLQQIIISAAKQSGQLFFPKLQPLQKLQKLFSDGLSFEQKFIAHCEGERKHIRDAYKKNARALLLIGPEGDFTKDEVEAAVNNNYLPVSLGNSILRVETAGVAACAIINAVNFEG